MNWGTPAAMAPGVSVVGMMRSLIAAKRLRCSAVNTVCVAEKPGAASAARARDKRRGQFRAQQRRRAGQQTAPVPHAHAISSMGGMVREPDATMQIREMAGRGWPRHSLLGWH